MTRTANLEGYAAEWVLVINVRTILISFFGHFRKFGSPPGNRFSGGGSVSAHVFRISVQVLVEKWAYMLECPRI